jgi:hypothetical protein
LRKEVKSCCKPRVAIAAGYLNDFSNKLSGIGPYVYDTDKYPPLEHDQLDQLEPKTGLDSLAQLFIWKRGDWQKYKNFLSYYSDNALSDAPKKGVVNFAFAHHLLSNKRMPIFDQHSARAVWAIMGSRDSAWDHYRDYMFYKKDHWRTDSEYLKVNLQAKCYRDFLLDVAYLAGSTNDDAKQYAAADRLLMPLGKAIKDHVKTLDDFYKLCGF